MRNLAKKFCSLALLTVFFSVGAQTTDNKNSFKEINLFDSSKDNIKKFSSSTCSWIKDSNYLPKLKLISDGNGKAVEFTYFGTKGMARSNMSCAKIVKEQFQAGKKIIGIKIIIDCKPDDTGKIDLMGFTRSGTFVKTIVLQKGTREYIFRRGHAVQKPDWNLLKFFGIWNKATKVYAKKFNLKQVFLLVKVHNGKTK